MGTFLGRVATLFTVTGPLVFVVGVFPALVLIGLPVRLVTGSQNAGGIATGAALLTLAWVFTAPDDKESRTKPSKVYARAMDSKTAAGGRDPLQIARASAPRTFHWSRPTLRCA